MRGAGEAVGVVGGEAHGRRHAHAGQQPRCSRSCISRSIDSSNAPHMVTACPPVVSRMEQTVAMAPSPRIVTRSRSAMGRILSTEARGGTGGAARALRPRGSGVQWRACRVPVPAIPRPTPRRAGDPPADDPLRLEHCPACGYALEGLAPEGVCPECGVAYDQTEVVLHGYGAGRRGDVATARPGVAVAVGASYVLVVCWGFTVGPATAGASWVICSGPRSSPSVSRGRCGSDRPPTCRGSCRCASRPAAPSRSTTPRPIGSNRGP